MVRPLRMAAARRLYIRGCLADCKVEFRFFPVLQVAEIIPQQSGIVVSRIAGIIRGDPVNRCPVTSLSGSDLTLTKAGKVTFKVTISQDNCNDVVYTINVTVS